MAGHGGNQVIRRRIVDALYRVQPQPVEMKFGDQYAALAMKYSRRRGVRAIEVERVAPLVLVAIREVGLRVLRCTDPDGPKWL